jgi:hypothetical protein
MWARLLFHVNLHLDSFLSEKLGVAFEKFSFLCAQISSSIAEHNYQLEIIIAQVASIFIQIKNVAESIPEKRVEVEDSSD